MVAVRWKGGNRYRDRAAIRVAQRLALGLPKPAVARAERTDEAAIDALLARDGFAEAIAAWQAILDESSPDFMARLEKLCRIALHNALMEWDVGAAFFARRELRQGRDPARVLAERVRERAKRAPRPLAPSAPVAPLAPLPPLDPAYDPLDALVRRSEAALHRDVLAEQAVAVTAQAAGPGTAAAARQALARKRAAATASRITHRLCQGTGTLALLGDRPLAGPRAVAEPRRTRAP